MGTANKLQPNTTQIPNVLIDEWMSELTDTAFKVVMVIARQTYGWHKESDRLSYTQLQEKTKSSRASVARAIDLLLKKKLIVRYAIGQDLYYSLNTGLKTELVTISTSLESELSTSLKSEHTKETNTKEILDLSNIKQPAVVEGGKSYGKQEINRILEVFKQVTGLDRPSDRNPRFAANAFLRNKDRRVDDFKPCLEFLVNTKGYDLTSIGAVNRHYSEYKRDMKVAVKMSTPEPFRGFDLS